MNKWHTPEDEMPPIGKRVDVEIILPYGFKMHTTGYFTVKGWNILACAKEYRVSKWRYFCNDSDPADCDSDT